MRVAIAGAGAVGRSVARELIGNGHRVLLIDKDPSALKPERVGVSLPKFTIDPPQAIALSDVLKGLGMVNAFARKLADFTGMAAPPDPADRLVISQVFHKAFVKVDEKGTEAAAATAILMERAGGPPPARPKEFTADHPFLFVIRDVRSGLILFLGRLVDPA